MERYAVLKLLKTKEELEKHGYGFIYEECQEDALIDEEDLTELY